VTDTGNGVGCNTGTVPKKVDWVLEKGANKDMRIGQGGSLGDVAKDHSLG